jgi:predicted RecA/RadA family phage recombinase
MRNTVQPGVNLTLTAPYALTSGQGFQVGVIFAVASTDAASGAEVVGVTEDVFTLTKAAGIAFTQGAAAYWDNAARNVTTTASGNKLIGAATQAAAGGDATVNVKLTGQV